MRRLGIRLAALGLLLGLLPISVSGCGITCACLSTPDPNWTPPPVSAQEATAAAAKFASSGSPATEPTGLDASLAYASQDHPLYSVQGPTVGAFVEAQGGLVIYFVQVDMLPDSSDVAISSAEAKARATVFLSDRGRGTGILVATTTLKTGVTSSYVVTWAAEGSSDGQISVSINASTGKAFAFVDQRFGVRLVPPSIGASEAGKLALAAAATPGEVVLSAEFRLDFEHPTWDVSVGTPGSGDSAAPEHYAFVEIDALTGTATVKKSD